MSFYTTLAGISMGFLALVGVFMFYRISLIRNLLLGQGVAILQKQQNYSKKQKEKEGLINMSKKQLLRLNDAICRKNIYGVYEAIYNIAIKERSSRILCNLDKGFDNHILIKFKETLNYMKFIMISGVFYILIFSTFSLLPFLHHSFGFNESPHCVSSVFIIVVGSYLLLISFLLFNKIGFEREKYQQVKELKKQHKEKIACK